MAEAKKMRSEASTSGSGVGHGGARESVVVDNGRRRSFCGYCKSAATTRISHGLWAHSLTVDAYQVLLDRGWRRSGCYLYKPDMEKTCCPSYTIRLKATDFVPSKEQIRVYRKMDRFLEGKLDVKRTYISEDGTISGGLDGTELHFDKTHVSMKESLVCNSNTNDKAGQLVHLLSDQINSSIQLHLKSLDLKCDVQLPKASVKKVVGSKKKFQAQESEELMFSCSAAFQIFATLKRLKRVVEHGEVAEVGLVDKIDWNEQSPERLAELFASQSKLQAESYGLSVRACNGHINYYSTGSHVEVEVGRSTRKSETTLSAGSDNDKHSKKSCNQKPQHTLEIRLRKSCFDLEEYSLYSKYQLMVHNDTPDRVTESSYQRFLVDTPLIHIPPNGDSAVPPCGFGSFHQQYVVDGKLLAVGVIDILPNCLSSKYLFWDPEFAFLSLGKYSALEEIRWVKENQMHCPSLQYYYLGYYIHSCSKMRYKAAYQPCELLCPLRYEWIPYDIAKPLLDKRKYVALSDYADVEPSAPNTDGGVAEELSNSVEQEHADDLLVNDDEMTEADSDSSDDETSIAAATSMEVADVDLRHLLIGVRGQRLRYKDIQQAFHPDQRRHMQNQLQRYVKAVGRQLSQEMVYALG